MTLAPLSHDADLTTNDINVLENAEALRGLFATLGYDVDDTPPLPHAALSLDTDDLTQRIKAIRRIASGHDDIEVYLFDVRSVTVALTQQIARRFRERLGDHLLILTSDYETLDFVLFDRDQASKSSAPGSAIRYTIRPRILTVDRRRPNPVALRVLRRFSLTEPDDLLQWDKLRSAYTLAEWSEPEFNNRALFSDYYLKHRVADEKLNPAWKEDVRGVAGKARELIASARGKFGKQPESAIRAGLIEPLFTLMGFAFSPVKAGDSSADTPDYTLHAPDADKPLALALTYAWNRNLDAVDPSRDDETPNENPGALVASLLEKAAAPWVIMTNGKLWRLYAASASNRVTNYYEIDLEEALFAPGAARDDAFKFWWLLFRREAFTGFLDGVLSGSQEYARHIGENLKSKIYGQIFGYFAGGFIQHMRDQGIADADIDREAVFHATMTFLYRLMFILYAESLELLPVKEENGYGAHSLKRLKEEIAQAGGAIADAADDALKDEYADDEYMLYERLTALFAAIDTGKADLNLPMYNGGLFSPDTPAGQFLSRRAIPDVYLALGLDRLARDVDDKTQALVFIDFKSLGVRQLGSIYEGLLEFKLRIADQKMAVIREKGRELYMPHAAALKARKNVLETITPGQVYIENTKQERKATGSYYTPDYIVKYIVQHTVGPVLDEKFKALEPRLRAMQARYREHKKQVDFKNRQRPRATQPAELFWNADPDTPLGRDIQQLADDCLNVRVLDPAMGSGHFLVEVVDYLSNRLLDFLNAWTDNPVRALIERTRADILAEMERQGVSIDPARLTDVALLRRAVLKRCVYGVDLNEMAVELAKVSLWLDAFTLGAPLSFLDHHLKCGNSLIGARLQDVYQGQLPLFAQRLVQRIERVRRGMETIGDLPDSTVSQAQESKNLYQRIYKEVDPLRRLLNVHVSRWFGNDGKVGKGKKATDHATLFLRDDRIEAWLDDPDPAYLPTDSLLPWADIAATAQRAAAQYRFFHWELEFPEVFFAPSTPGGQDVQLREDGGFDAVVGNPPYVNALERAKIETVGEKNYQKANFATANGAFDLYILFWEAGFHVAHSKAQVGMITPSKYLSAPYAESLRRHIVENHRVLSFYDLTRVNPFEDPSVYPLVSIIQCTRTIAEYDFDVAKAQSGKPDFLKRFSSADLSILPEFLWGFLLSAGIDVLKKVTANSDQFDAVAEIVASSTASEADAYEDVLVTQPSGRLKHLPLVETGTIDRFEVTWDSHRDGHYLRLDTRIVGERRIQQYQQPKLIFAKIAERIEACSDQVGEYASRNTNFAFPSTYRLEFFAALMNSKLMTWIYGQYFGALVMSGGDLQFQAPQLRLVPVRRIAFTTPPDRRAQLADAGRALYQRALSEGPAPVLAFTAERLAHDESDAVHDLLAHLAEQMIALNKQKQAEVKRFLAWLEARLHIRPSPRPEGEGQGVRVGIDSLTGKTILQGYLGDYQKGEPETPFEDFFYRLHQNRGRFGVALSDLKAEIEDEYRKSLDALLPIKAQLATTDALIDRVVYQLYGLTDDEIRLIEYPGLEQAVASARQDVLKEKDVEPASDEAVEKIAAKVEQAAGQYLARVDESQIEAELRAEIAGWDGLPGNVRTFLVTGELLLRQSALPDYSPVVISFGKAAEVALNERLFAPFRATHRESDCDNPVLRRFMAGTKTLSLGAMPIVLASSSEHKLRAFIGARYPNAATTIFARNALLARLTQDQIDRYRNSAAHDAVLSAEDARAARQWAIEILGYV